MNIKLLRIAYDVDHIWDDGCRGSDFLPDSFGDESLLLISESGSAYVCPEGMAGEWRVYVDSCGRQARLASQPGEQRPDVGHFGGWPSFIDVVACGLAANPQIAESIALVGLCEGNNEPKPIPAMFEGLLIETGGYKIEFEKDRVSLKNYDTTYWIDGSGLPQKLVEEENCGPSGDYYEEQCVPTEKRYIPTEVGLRDLIDYLIREKKFKNRYESYVIDVLAGLLENGVQRLAEINDFESRCEEYFTTGR